MAVITIDGTRLEVPENKNVLECALEAGIYIPHLCHHPDLPENGSCRMCIVEVEGQEGVTTSCTLRAQDGIIPQVSGSTNCVPWLWNYCLPDIRKIVPRVRNTVTASFRH